MELLQLRPPYNSILNLTVTKKNLMLLSRLHQPHPFRTAYPSATFLRYIYLDSAMFPFDLSSYYNVKQIRKYYKISLKTTQN